jgi:hypothetical protein
MLFKGQRGPLSRITRKKAVSRVGDAPKQNSVLRGATEDASPAVRGNTGNTCHP